MGRVHSSEIAEHVSEQIKYWRKKKDLSQTELGRRVGLSFQQIQKYEMNTSRITIDALAEIARVLEVPLSSFLPRTETKSEIFAAIEQQLDLLITESVVMETIESAIRAGLEKLK